MTPVTAPREIDLELLDFVVGGASVLAAYNARRQMPSRTAARTPQLFTLPGRP